MDSVASSACLYQILYLRVLWVRPSNEWVICRDVFSFALYPNYQSLETSQYLHVHNNLKIFIFQTSISFFTWSHLIQNLQCNPLKWSKIKIPNTKYLKFQKQFTQIMTNFIKLIALQTFSFNSNLPDFRKIKQFLLCFKASLIKLYYYYLY